MSKITVFHPIGKERERLIANTGLTVWSIRGEPTLTNLSVTQIPSLDRMMEVWSFRWIDIIQDEVREHMLKATMKQRGLGRYAAMRWLETHPSAVPCAEVVVELSLSD